MAWQLDDTVPIYQQLIDKLEGLILIGRYKSGERLPSVRDLAQEAAVNPNTMQRALAELEQGGLIETHRTSGRTITDDQGRIDALRKARADALCSQYLGDMHRLGYSSAQSLSILTQYQKEDNLHGPDSDL